MAEIIRAVETRRAEIKEVINKRYLDKIQSFKNMEYETNKKIGDIKAINMIFEKLITFMDSNVDARILQRADDVTNFMHKSFTDLETMS